MPNLTPQLKLQIFEILAEWVEIDAYAESGTQLEIAQPYIEKLIELGFTFDTSINLLTEVFIWQNPESIPDFDNLLIYL